MIANWDHLAEDFDDDLAKSLLELHIGKTIDPVDAVNKSLYNFDLESPEGVDRLLELLPILDPDIINEVYQEIFPGYPTDTLSPRMVRIELRGYLMDYLEDSDRREGTADTGGVEAPQVEEPGAGEAGVSPEVPQPEEPGPEPAP